VRQILRAGLALAVAGALLVVGWGSVNQLRVQRAVERACDATAAGRHAEALRLSADLAGPDGEGRIAAECRCWSLLASERRGECVALLEGVLGHAEAADWVPDPLLVRLVVAEHRDAGRHERAAALARRAAAAHPDDLHLLQAELLARSAVEGEERVIEDMARRLEDPERATPAQRLVLAVAHARRSEPEAALRVLGDALPPVDHELFPMWIETRADALADQERFEEVRRLYARWRELGGPPAEVDARFAMRLSLSQLRHPEHSWTELLLDALEDRERIDNPALVEVLYRRAIAHLLVDGRRADALALYEEARERFGLEASLREQIVRGGAGTPQSDAAGTGTATGTGRLVFRRPSGAGAALPAETRPGAVWLQPPADEPGDAPWERLEWRGEVAVAERAPGPWPHRWVYLDGRGRPRASGSVWPSSGREVEVMIEPRPARTASAALLPERAAADGRRRVFVVLPDCMDWRLAQYLRVRGELPVLDHLLETGHRAVLRSWPPLTAAAMESLVWPSRGRYVTFAGLVHRMGLEVGGLASVGRNPLEFLSALLPAGESLFEAVGAGDRVAANMLFSHGMIDAGRHAQLVGPRGLRRPARPVPAYRPLDGTERERFPGLAETGTARSLAEGLAASMDAAVAMAREDEVDFLMLRLEPLDILTHMFFGDLTVTRQDDGRSPLFDAYRYVDHRLGELAGALDADDVLVVMSDHGIRTAMEHSEDAIFVATGAGVPRGRAEGQPDLRGVPRALAGLFGVRTDWPRTGVAPFAEPGRTARAGSR